jgi:hypothetical protein
MDAVLCTASLRRPRPYRARASIRPLRIGSICRTPESGVLRSRGESKRLPQRDRLSSSVFDSRYIGVDRREAAPRCRARNGRVRARRELLLVPEEHRGRARKFSPITLEWTIEATLRPEAAYRTGETNEPRVPLSQRLVALPLQVGATASAICHMSRALHHIGSAGTSCAPSRDAFRPRKSGRKRCRLDLRAREQPFRHFRCQGR